MRIRIERNGRTVRLFPDGALTAETGGALRRAAAQVLEAGARYIEIDAVRLRFIDAAGLGELVACMRMIQASGADFRFCGARGKTRELVKLTGLDALLMPGDPASGIRLHFRVA